MRASIVIASLNEGDRLWRTVASCQEDMGTLDCEIVVADDGSQDGSLDGLRRRFPQVPVFVQPERGGPAPTKDLGARHSRGDVLVFLDGHCKPESGAVPRLVASVEQLAGRAIVTPRIPALNAETWHNNPYQVGHGYWIDLDEFRCGFIGLERLRPHASATKTAFYESPALIGCCFAISRWLYQRLWGFDTDMRMYGVEDIDFGLKSWLMGYPICHDPGATIGHRFQASFESYSVPMEHLLANQLRMARKNFTEPVWQEWLERWRSRNPSALCEAAWMLFEVRRESVEREREYLLANRVHDEFCYAERFQLPWPVRPRVPAVTSQASFPRLAGISGSSAGQHAGLEPAETVDDELLREEAFERYLDHYRHPRNRQALPQAQAVGTIEWAGGAVLTFSLQLARCPKGSLVIERAVFQSQRCGIAVAYASLLSEWVRGRSVEEAWCIDPVELMQQFGPRAGAVDAAGRAISALRQALAQVPGAGPTDPIGA
jgi:GT2 family glycosyltransferase/NifU-like protein involved in Fe-S cluster formation